MGKHVEKPIEKFMMKRKTIKTTEPFAKPDFDGNTDHMTELKNGLNYYNYKYSHKDAKNWTVKWMEKDKKYSDILPKFKSLKDHQVSFTFGSICKMSLDGASLETETVSRIENSIHNAIDRYFVEIKNPEKKTNTNVISIQDRIRDKANLFMGEYIEGEFDNLRTNLFKSDFDMGKVLNEHEVSGAVATIIASTYQVWVDEFQEAIDGDEYMKEAYSGYTRASLKALMKFTKKIVKDAEFHVEKSKAIRKSAKKKVVPADKLVKKLNYKKSDPELKIVSESPTKIIGANEVWLYNVKTRKLIHVVGDDLLTVSGTTIKNMDSNKSEMKTLRKPAEQLLEFKKARKTTVRKFMDILTTKSSKFSGRMSNDIIILKCT
jgi:hypothetical protein